MQSSKMVSATIMSVSLVLVSATGVQASVIRQTQEFSNSSSVKVEGGSDVKAEAESSSWGKQSQRVVTDEVDVPSYRYRPTHGVATSWKRKNRSANAVWVHPAAHGEVRLSWDLRGGTCHVRYNEATTAGYNYSTSTSCDDGEIRIGGLVAGQNYRFQVRQDDGAWSRAITVRAW